MLQAPAVSTTVTRSPYRAWVTRRSTSHRRSSTVMAASQASDVDRVGQGGGVEGAGLVGLGPQGGDGHVDPGVIRRRRDGRRRGEGDRRRRCCPAGARLAGAGATGGQDHECQRDERHRRPLTPKRVAPPAPGGDHWCHSLGAGGPRTGSEWHRWHRGGTPSAIRSATGDGLMPRPSRSPGTGTGRASAARPPAGRRGATRTRRSGYPVDTCRKIAEPSPGVRDVL